MRRIPVVSARKNPCRAAIAALFIVAAPSVMGAEVSYTGTWQCDASPKANIPSFSVPASAVVDGERVTVSRVVYRPGSYTEVAGEMNGKGAVRDGRVIVEMATASGNLSGKFEGKVSSTEMTLAGTEMLRIPDRGEDQRACKALLTRK